MIRLFVLLLVFVPLRAQWGPVLLEPESPRYEWLLTYAGTASNYTLTLGSGNTRWTVRGQNGAIVHTETSDQLVFNMSSYAGTKTVLFEVDDPADVTSQGFGSQTGSSGIIPDWFSKANYSGGFGAFGNDIKGDIPLLGNSITGVFMASTNITTFRNIPEAATAVFLSGTNTLGSPYPSGAFNCCASLASLYVGNASWTQAEVDEMLSDLVDSLAIPGRVTCTFDVSSSAAPSAAGEADATTLRNAGWTVTTD